MEIECRGSYQSFVGEYNGGTGSFFDSQCTSLQIKHGRIVPGDHRIYGKRSGARTSSGSINRDGIPTRLGNYLQHLYALLFDELDKLAKGDKFSVIDENGATTTFVVRMIRVYGARDDASEVFGSHDGVAHLNLITCEGVWNRFKKSYASRLVIFSDKVAPS